MNKQKPTKLENNGDHGVLGCAGWVALASLTFLLCLVIMYVGGVF